LLIEEQTIQCPKQDKTMAHETPHKKLKIEHYKNYFKFMKSMYLHGKGKML
jgi:hypothetical protein